MFDETVERRWGLRPRGGIGIRCGPTGGDDPRSDVADAYRGLPFLTALVVSARYDRRKGRRHKVHRLQQMLVCLRRWLPEVVVADGGYAKVPAALPEHVKADCRRHQTAQGRVPVPARATAAARPDRAAPGGRRACTAVGCYTMVLPRPHGSTAMVELASGVALWYHGGPPAFPYVGSSSDTWRSAVPRCTHRGRNPCGYCSGICSKYVVGTSHRPNHPRPLWPFTDSRSKQRKRMAPRRPRRSTQWYRVRDTSGCRRTNESRIDTLDAA